MASARSLFVLMLLVTGFFAAFMIASPVVVSAADDDDEAQDDVNIQEEDKSEINIEEEEEEERQPMIQTTTDVIPRYVFAGIEDGKLRIGQEATLLIGFKNTGTRGYNITAVGAHLAAASDHTFIIQNFTSYGIRGAFLPAGSQASIEYTFTPDASLDPAEFWLTAWVLYNYTVQPYFSPIYNSTIDLVAPAQEFSVTKFLSYGLIAAVFGVSIYIALQAFGGSGSSKSGSKRTVETGTTSASSEPDDDLPIYTPKKTSQPVKRSASRPKTPKSN